ncbi:MAG: 30S ribosomal protein S6 [Verrucomicrobia bacterium]|nr:30S ribosomal protein S6 [Verrucomicrobiota bacterium]
MKNRYEGLLVLDTQGKEETVKDIIERLEKDFGKEGAEIEGVQRMERRDFSYVAGPLTGGYYVNVVFHAEPAALDKLRAKFKLDPEVYRQHYTKLGAKKPAKKR